MQGQFFGNSDFLTDTGKKVRAAHLRDMTGNIV